MLGCCYGAAMGLLPSKEWLNLRLHERARNVVRLRRTWQTEYIKVYANGARTVLRGPPTLAYRNARTTPLEPGGSNKASLPWRCSPTLFHLPDLQPASESPSPWLTPSVRARGIGRCTRVGYGPNGNRRWIPFGDHPFKLERYRED